MSQENKFADTFPWDYKFGDENFQKEPWILNKGKQNVTIEKNLDNKGFLQPIHKRQSMIRNISNIFHRINLSEQEIRILLGIFTTLNDLNNKS